MKYKDFNKIVEAYSKMAIQAEMDGNRNYAIACRLIIEDLKSVYRQGSGKLLSKKKEEQ